MIDTNVIRDKVLSLAVNGKLVKQDFTEESADILISRINEDLHGQIHAETWKKDEIPFEIPTNWSWCRLSDIGYTNIGLTYHPQDIVKDGIIVIRSSNIINGEIDYTDLVKVNCPIRENQYLNRNDIVICVRNGSKALVGKCAIFKETSRKVAFGAFMAIFRTPCYRYVYHYLNTQLFRRYFNSDDTKQINQITQKILKNALIPLPPQNEQNRIVDKIEEIFSVLDTIDEYQSQYLLNVEILRYKIIDAGLRGKLTEQLPENRTAEDLYVDLLSEKAKILERRKSREDKKIKVVKNDVPFKIPSYWKWIRLGDIGLFKKGPFGSALTKAMFVQKGDDTVKVYEQQHAIKKDWELGTYYISREYFNEKMSGFEVMPGDIIVSCAGTIGETYIMPDEIEQGIINQALMRVTLADGIDKNFFLYYFNTNLKKSAQEESNGSAIKNIPPFEVLKNWYFPLTSIEEQRRIVSKLDGILAYAKL